MIVFTRLNGGPIAINPDLIERVEETPDTVITLVDEKKFLIDQSLEDVINLIVDYRAYIIARADTLEVVEEPRPTLHLVPQVTVVPPTEPSETDDDARIIDYLTSLPNDSETT